MKKTILMIACLLLVPALCLAEPVTKEDILGYLNWQELTESFSADLTSSISAPAKSFTRKSKIHKRGTDLLRVDAEPALLRALAKNQKPLGDLVLVKNLEEKKVYMMFPERKSYFEASSEQMKLIMQQLAGQLHQQVNVKKPNLKGFKSQGTERIEGIKCEKYHCIAPLKNGGSADITAWLSPKHNNFPIKTDITATGPSGGATNHKTMFHNFKWLPPSKSLFKVPSDYTKYQNLRQLANEGQPGPRMKKARERREQQRKKFGR